MTDEANLFRQAYSALVDLAPEPPALQALDVTGLTPRVARHRFGWQAAATAFAVTLVAVGGVALLVPLAGESNQPRVDASDIGLTQPGTGYYLSTGLPQGFRPTIGTSDGTAPIIDGEIALLDGGGLILVLALPAGGAGNWTGMAPEPDSVLVERSIGDADVVVLGRAVAGTQVDDVIDSIRISAEDGSVEFDSVANPLGGETLIRPFASDPPVYSETTYSHGAASLTIATIKGEGQWLLLDLLAGDGLYDPVGDGTEGLFVRGFDSGGYSVLASGNGVSQEQFDTFVEGLIEVPQEEWAEAVGWSDPMVGTTEEVVLASDDGWRLVTLVETTDAGQRTCYRLDSTGASPVTALAPTSGCVTTEQAGQLWRSIEVALVFPDTVLVLAVLGTQPVDGVRVSELGTGDGVLFEPVKMPGSEVQFSVAELPVGWTGYTVELLDGGGVVLDTIDLDWR
jgi:hypothetical protein